MGLSNVRGGWNEAGSEGAKGIRADEVREVKVARSSRTKAKAGSNRHQMIQLPTYSNDLKY